jgi:hypothetical protein
MTLVGHFPAVDSQATARRTLVRQVGGIVGALSSGTEITWTSAGEGMSVPGNVVASSDSSPSGGGKDNGASSNASEDEEDDVCDADVAQPLRGRAVRRVEVSAAGRFIDDFGAIATTSKQRAMRDGCKIAQLDLYTAEWQFIEHAKSSGNTRGQQIPNTRSIHVSGMCPACGRKGCVIHLC